MVNKEIQRVSLTGLQVIAGTLLVLYIMMLFRVSVVYCNFCSVSRDFRVLTCAYLLLLYSGVTETPSKYKFGAYYWYTGEQQTV